MTRTATVSAVLRLLARTTPWIESELTGLSQVVHAGDHCLDVGAAAGIYTAVLSDLVGGGGVVHSVEPLRFAYPPLLRKALAPGSNARFYGVALGSAAGEFSMSLPVRRGRFVTGRSFLSAGADGLGSNVEFDAHVRVDVVAQTLDVFAKENGIERLDFLKADVEGAELDLLEGGEEAITGLRPKLLLEIEERHVRRYGRTAHSVAEWLTDRGYRMHVWQGGRWTPVSKVDTELRNHLFLPA
jgi:FkbM family methyltransferase